MGIETYTEIEQLKGRAGADNDLQNPAGDISQGVEIPIGNVDAVTVYLSAAGAVNIEVEATPNGENWFTLPESPVEFKEAGEDAVHIEYNTLGLRLTGSNGTEVQAIVREVV